MCPTSPSPATPTKVPSYRRQKLLYAAAYPCHDWLAWTEGHTPGTAALLEEGRRAGLPLGDGRHPAPFCNNYLCHYAVFAAVAGLWRRCFDYYLGRYGLAVPIRPTGDGFRNRLAGCFYETVTMAIVSGLTDAVGIKTVPFPDVTSGDYDFDLLAAAGQPVPPERLRPPAA